MKSFGDDAFKFSMGAKLNTFTGIGANKNNLTPGPGSYKPVVKINDKGKYPISKIENLKVYDFGSSKTRRFYTQGKYFC